MLNIIGSNNYKSAFKAFLSNSASVKCGVLGHNPETHNPEYPQPGNPQPGIPITRKTRNLEET